MLVIIGRNSKRVQLGWEPSQRTSYKGWGSGNFGGTSLTRPTAIVHQSRLSRNDRLPPPLTKSWLLRLVASRYTK